MTTLFNYRGTPLKYRPMVYTIRRYAEASAARCLRPHRVILDAARGNYIVVCPADARRLIRDGGLQYA